MLPGVHALPVRRVLGPTPAFKVLGIRKGAVVVHFGLLPHSLPARPYGGPVLERENQAMWRTKRTRIPRRPTFRLGVLSRRVARRDHLPQLIVSQQ